MYFATWRVLEETVVGHYDPCTTSEQYCVQHQLSELHWPALLHFTAQIFTESAPLCWFSNIVAMSMCLSWCLQYRVQFFFRGGHWPWGHMISSSPLIDSPSLDFMTALYYDKFIYNYAHNIEPTHPTIFSFCIVLHSTSQYQDILWHCTALHHNNEFTALHKTMALCLTVNN